MIPDSRIHPHLNHRSFNNTLGDIIGNIQIEPVQVIFIDGKELLPMIRKCTRTDSGNIHEIINDAASAYKGVIPGDRWHDPYMPAEELEDEIGKGVEFWCYEETGKILGVMGIQDKGNVTLIRHAYVLTKHRNKGIGSKLLLHLMSAAKRPVLIGTWKDATWAIDFYLKHGFRLVTHSQKERLLREYWDIPDRQIETSVVLAGPGWKE